MISAEDIKIERIEENLKSRFLDRFGHKKFYRKTGKMLKIRMKIIFREMHRRWRNGKLS